MPDPIATRAVQAMLDSLQLIAELDGKTFHVLAESELLEISGKLPVPCAGVIYEGLQARQSSGPTHRAGLASDLGIAVIIFYKAAHPLGQLQANAYKLQAIQLLDTFRSKIRDTQGPSGHVWRFVSEAPAMERNGIVVWAQRWSLPVNS
jgi:hypothetical protein